MSVIIDLFQALHERLGELVPGIERRYMPRRDATELVSLKTCIYLESTERQEIVRDVVDAENYTFGIAVQRSAFAVDQAEVDTDGNPVFDGIDNLAFGDEVLNKMEEIKDFWRAGGILRNEIIARCRFIEMIHDPVYEPYHLGLMGVFSAILDVTYQHSGS